MSDRLWEDGKTSVFRPSYSATSLFCAGSLIPSMTAADSAGWEAAEGTVFHELIAEWQTTARPDYLLGTRRSIQNGDQVFEIEITEEMFLNAEECLRRYADTPGDRYVETRVDISSVTPIPGQSGTCDLAFCTPGHLDITDWKYGKGVQVFAPHNTQLLLYALGFFTEFDSIYRFETITLRIAQPRLNHFDTWEINRAELLEFAEFARARWAEAWVPHAPRSPGQKQCQWCKIRLTCPALEVARQALVDLCFDVLEEPVTDETQRAVVPKEPHLLVPPAELSTEDLARIYQYRKLMEAWFSDIGDALIARGLAGEDLGCWKVVEGRPGKRHWVDEEKAAAGLLRIGVPEDSLYETKLISPYQTEKLVRAAGVRGPLGKDFINMFTDRSPGRPTLVPTADARVDLVAAVDEAFEP